MMNTEIRERLDNCRTLPTLPGVAIQILDLCQSDDVSLSRMAEVMGRDPALCAKVLSIANSAAYGLTRQIATLDHAVTLLGVHTVRTVALSFSIVRGLRGKDRGVAELTKVWRRSLVAAVAARVLGQMHHMNNQEVLFLAALLQDIGMLALREACPKTYPQMVAQSEGDHGCLVELEKASFEEDHAAISAWLVEHWHLPEVYEVSLRYSHQPEQAEGEPALEETVKVVSLAALFADVWVTQDLPAATARVEEAARRMLRMEKQQVEEVLDRIEEMLPEISSLFEISVGDQDTLNDILERAKEALVETSIVSVQLARQAELKACTLEAQNQDLRARTEHDGLTGLYNRAFLDETLAREFARARERGTTLGIVFCDIDGFKQVNDTHGHPAGDAVLISVARILEGQVCQGDFVGRYGGDEFLMVLPERSVDEARVTCQKICQAVAAQPCSIEQGEHTRFIHTRLSLGCATLGTGEDYRDLDQLLQAADVALYRVKRAGGNGVEFVTRSTAGASAGSSATAHP